MLLEKAFIQWRMMDNFPQVTDIMDGSHFSNVYEVRWTKIVVIVSESI